MTAETLAQFFQEKFVELAPTFGFPIQNVQTWEMMPEPNKQLLIALADAMLDKLFAPPTPIGVAPLDGFVLNDEDDIFGTTVGRVLLTDKSL